MNKQSGYIDLDVGGVMIVLGIVVGIILTKIVSWAWPIIKAFIHALTA